MEDFIYENNVDGMRACDLRNLLVQKLGVSQDLVNRVLDRTELKEMVTSIVYRRLQDKSHDAMMQKVYITTVVVGVLTVLYMCRKFIFGVVDCCTPRSVSFPTNQHTSSNWLYSMLKTGSLLRRLH